jgi:hypothetical protein
MVLDTQSSIIIAMNKLASIGNLTYDDTVYAPQEIQFKKDQASNVSANVRDLLVTFE